MSSKARRRHDVAPSSVQANATEAGAVMPRGRNRQQADPELEVVPGSRLHQFVEWLGGPGGDCMIVLDGPFLTSSLPA